MFRVAILDSIAQEGLDRLAAADKIEYEVCLDENGKGLKGDALRETLLNFDAAVCRSGVKITAEALEGNRRLKAIARAGVGTDNIDKQAATRQGVVVMNTPAGNTLSTAEHAFALLLGLSRNVAPAYQSLVEGRWDRKAYMGSQLADKTLGIVGLGRIGREVARRALAFDMRVLAYDPFLSDEKARALGLERVENFRDMLPKVDYLTVHTPLTPETEGLFGIAELDLIKPGARLINCARGGIYDEAALVQGLQSGKLAGVALDVYPQEPCTDSPLFGMPGVLCTPHLGASTEEAQTQVALEACELVINFLTSGEIRHAVNVSAVDPKTLASLAAHLELAYRLGGFISQWHAGASTRLKLEYRGELADKNIRLLTASFAAGMLERSLAEEVNIVNSEVLLRERGVEIVEETRGELGSFRSSMAATLTGDGVTTTVGGALFGATMPRLIVIDDFRLEAYLDGVILAFKHRDVPGIIGALGTALGKHDVNIAQMAVGRAAGAPGGPAVAVLNLDADPPREALDEVLAHPQIEMARVLHLPPAGERPVWMS